ANQVQRSKLGSTEVISMLVARRSRRIRLSPGHPKVGRGVLAEPTWSPLRRANSARHTRQLALPVRDAAPRDSTLYNANPICLFFRFDPSPGPFRDADRVQAALAQW